MADSTWTLSDTTAKVAHRDLTARLDLAHPEQGLLEIQLASQPLSDAKLFQLRSDAFLNPDGKTSSVDRYVRGDDLVTVYEQQCADRLRVQSYWRAVAPPADANATILELVVSVQTDLLDSDPSLRIASDIAASEVLWLTDEGDARFDVVETPQDLVVALGETVGTPCVVLRLADADSSLVQMAHPTDSMQVEVASAGEQRVEVRHPLFGEPLEKGVIRRGRLQVAFVPRSEDEAVGAALFQNFAAAEPMLTA